MQGTERVPVRQAARELGCAPQAVRERMKRGIWDLGEVITPAQKDPSVQSHSYYIYRRKLNKILGIEGGDLT